MDGVGGTVKNVAFRKMKSGFLTIHTPFEFHEAVTKYVPAIKSIYFCESDLFEEPKYIDQEVDRKLIVDTLKVHKVDGCKVKGISGLKFHQLAEDESPFYTQWYANRKRVTVIRGTRTPRSMIITALLV